MFYYSVTRIGTGAEGDPKRPDIPEGTNYVGWSSNLVYLIATPSPLPEPFIPLTEAELQDLCDHLLLDIEQVKTWYVDS